MAGVTHRTDKASHHVRLGLAGRLAIFAAAAALVSAAAAGAGPAQAALTPAQVAGSTPAAAGIISTVAGGVGGPGKATNVSLLSPCGVSYSFGRVHIGDGLAVRNVNPQTDWLTTPTGNGIAGPAIDGLLATRASINACVVVFDQSGNAVLADGSASRVRVVAATTGTSYDQAMTAGHIYTVAGNGTQGFSGDGGPATKASLSFPFGVAVDKAGNLLVADLDNNRIRVVAVRTGRFYGRAMTAGDIYTVAGTGTPGFSGDRGPATQAQLTRPAAVGVDGAGNLVIADTDNNRVRVVAARTGTFYGRPMTAGHIYIVAGDGTPWPTGDGGPATKAGVRFPGGVAFDLAGNLVIAGGYSSNRIRVVAARTGTFYGQAMAAGDIYTVAGGGTGGLGDGIPATDAQLANPSSVAVDQAGNLVICDTISDRIRVVAARTGTFYGQAMTARHIYTVAGVGRPGFFGDGGPATAAGLTHPGGVAVDRTGNLLIGDTHSNRVRVVAASTGTFYGQAMTAGDIYTVAGGGKGRVENGGPAARARLLKPMGVAADAAGSLVIADTDNDLIRAVTG